MPNDSFASFGRRLDLFANGLKDPQLKAVMKRLGEAGQKDADKAAKADLGGDNKFSGWPSAPLVTELKYPAEGQVEVRPTGKARGSWRVAQDGRHADGGAGGFQGPAINRRTGNTMRTRSGGFRNSRARVKRWNGRTAGKNTWSDAEQTIERETPQRLDKEVAAEIRKAFD